MGRGGVLSAITPAGVGIVSRARRALEGTAAIRELAQMARASDLPQLSIGATHTQAKYALPQALARLCAEEPRLRVQVREPRLRRKQDQDEAAPDLMLYSTAGEMPDQGVAVPLYRWKRLVVTHLDHPLARREDLTLAELGQFPLISYHQPAVKLSSLQRACLEAGVRVQVSMTTLNADVVKTYVRAGAGLGLLPEMSEGQEDEQLAWAPAPRQIPSCIAWAVVPHNRPVRDHTLALLRMLAPALQSLPLRPILEARRQPTWPSPPTWKEYQVALRARAPLL